MSLLDQEIKPKKTKQNNKENVCDLCKQEKEKLNKEIQTCEDCFGIQLNMALNKIQENIKNIKDEIVKIENFIKEVNNILANNKNISLIMQNKAEIDLLNATSTIGKLKIDLETNRKAYEINQIQANKFRKANNWKEIDIVTI